MSRALGEAVPMLYVWTCRCMQYNKVLRSAELQKHFHFAETVCYCHYHQVCIGERHDMHQHHHQASLQMQHTDAELLRSTDKGLSQVGHLVWPCPCAASMYSLMQALQKGCWQFDTTGSSSGSWHTPHRPSSLPSASASCSFLVASAAPGAVAEWTTR